MSSLDDQGSPAIRLAALTQGPRVPSTRFRVEQHFGLLRRNGFCVEHLDASPGAYPPVGRLARGSWLALALADAACRSMRANRSEICLLQRELVSTLVTAEPLIRRPLVFDVDDAVFLHPRGRMTDAIARRAVVTICGNRFLAEHYAEHGAVTILPTAVDIERFLPAATPDPTVPVIGWSGTSSGFEYLTMIEPSIRAVLEMHPRARFVIVAERPPALPTLPAERWSFVPWSTDNEVELLQSFNVGLMPLRDDPWARGKCSFKMLTYMACARPVVVSPVGMNAEVLSLGAVGIAARSTDDWVQAIDSLLRDPDGAEGMGAEGRKVAVRHFSSEVIGVQLSSILRHAVGLTPSWGSA